jgi:hypothetical protein
MDDAVDVECFKTKTVYQLVAVTTGYISNKNDIKGNFSRSLRREKESSFWGFADLEIIYESLVSSSSVAAVTKTGDLYCKKYLWEFIRDNPYMIPNNC